GRGSRNDAVYCCPRAPEAMLRTVSPSGSQNQSPSTPVIEVVGYGTGSQLVSTSATVTSTSAALAGVAAVKPRGDGKFSRFPPRGSPTSGPQVSPVNRSSVVSRRYTGSVADVV